MTEWNGLPRFSKLASCIYPDLVGPTRRAEMEKLAAGEGRRLGGSALIGHEKRGPVSQLGGLAVSSQQQKRK
jgi:hypothetical protein